MLSCIGGGRASSEDQPQADGGTTAARATTSASSSSPPHLKSPVELSGTLQKRGPTRLHRYAARHFELRGRFLVYRRSAGADPSGYVDLCGAVLSANRDGAFGFYICSCYAHRDYALLAATAAQRRDWTDALMRNITACTTPASVAALLTAAPASSRSLRKLKRYPTHSHYLKDQLTSRALHEGPLWRKTGAVGTYRRRIYELLPEGVLFYTRDDDEDGGDAAGSPRRGCVPSVAAAGCRSGGGGGGGGGARSHNRYYKLMNVRGASAERTSDGFVLRGPFLRDRSCTFLTETPAAREAWLRAFQAAAAQPPHAPPPPSSLLLRPCVSVSALKALPSGDNDDGGAGEPRRRRPITTSDLPPPTPSSSFGRRGGSSSSAGASAEAEAAAAAAERLREVRANRVPLSFPQISRLQHSIREAEGLLQGGGRGGEGEEALLLRAELDEARQAHLVWLDLYDMERDQVVGDDMCDAVDDALEAAEDEAQPEAAGGGGDGGAAAAADAERRLTAAEEWLCGTFVQRHVVGGGGGGGAAEEGPAVIPAEAFRGRLAAQRARLERLRGGDAEVSRAEVEVEVAAAGPALWDDDAPYDESVGSSRSGSAGSSGCGGQESGGGGGGGDGAEAAATFRTMGAGAAAAAATAAAVPVPAFGGAAVGDREAVVASVCACATRVQEVLVRGNVTSKNRGGIGADVAALAAWRRGVLAAAETFGKLRRSADTLVIVDDDLLSSTLSRVESVVQVCVVVMVDGWAIFFSSFFT